MNAKTTRSLICTCGHMGEITMTEHPSRFSKCWKEYSIRGFKASNPEIDGWPTFEQALAKLSPKCPHQTKHSAPGEVHCVSIVDEASLASQIRGAA